MNDEIAISKGATKTDLRLTREPADTPRGRLHRLAATSTRSVAELKRVVKIDNDDLSELRYLARRGIKRLTEHSNPDRGRGAALVLRLCYGIDKTIFAMTMLDVDSVDAMSEGLTVTLMQLESAENSIRDLAAELKSAKQDLKTERGNVSQLRTLLAQAHAEVAKREIESAGSWDTPTRRAELTAEQKQAIEKPSDE